MSPLSLVRLASVALTFCSLSSNASPLIQTTVDKRQNAGMYVPYYDTSANGFKSAARGWNSFAIQAASDTLKKDAGWDFNDYHFRQHCDQIVVTEGFDYYCSIDSGWAQGCNGDDNGIPVPDTNVLPNIKDLSDYLHGKGLKLGVYVLPGAFTGDKDKTIVGTSIKIGDVFGSDAGNSPNCRTNFDYTKDGVQQWHDSVIKSFVASGIDMIKLDYVTPGSPGTGDDTKLPTNSSGSVAAFHQAIKNNNANIRLDISWKLDRSDPYWGIWQSSADSLRLDQDTNAAGESKLTTWPQVLRVLDYYRQFINEQTQPSRQGQPIKIRPDLDNLFVGNPETISGLSDAQRYTQAIHWIGAGANLIAGSDMTRLDTLGKELLFNPEAMDIAAFTAQYPMQPRNPQGWGTAGGSDAMQLQAWIAGPNEQNEAVVVLANYGPDPCLNGGCDKTYGLDWGDVHNVDATLEDLGLASISGSWDVKRIWGGGGSGGNDHADVYRITGRIECNLGPGESALYKLTKAA
jgi:alpha-galactosidase